MVLTATTLVGKLRNPLKPLVGKKVLIQSKVGRTGTWRTIATRTTNKNGAFSKKVKLSINRSFRATYAGGKTQYPGVSNLSVIRVKLARLAGVVQDLGGQGRQGDLRRIGRTEPSGYPGLPAALQPWFLAHSEVDAPDVDQQVRVRDTTTSRVDYRWRVMRPSGDLLRGRREQEGHPHRPAERERSQGRAAVGESAARSAGRSGMEGSHSGRVRRS